MWCGRGTETGFFLNFIPAFQQGCVSLLVSFRISEAIFHSSYFILMLHYSFSRQNDCIFKEFVIPVIVVDEWILNSDRHRWGTCTAESPTTQACQSSARPCVLSPKSQRNTKTRLNSPVGEELSKQCHPKVETLLTQAFLLKWRNGSWFYAKKAMRVISTTSTMGVRRHHLSYIYVITFIEHWWACCRWREAPLHQLPYPVKYSWERDVEDREGGLRKWE